MDYNKYIFDRLIDIAKRHADCIAEHQKIISMCPQKKMSRGIGLLGIYLPDEQLRDCTWDKGKPTKNEKIGITTIFLTNLEGNGLQKDMLMIAKH